MTRVGVKCEAGEYVVVVENVEQGYKRQFEVYRPARGLFGPSPAGVEAAQQAANEDARDWVEKFLLAGIRADLVEM